MNTAEADKWFWKMKWLKKNGWPPADPYFWQKAEDAYWDTYWAMHSNSQLQENNGSN